MTTACAGYRKILSAIKRRPKSVAESNEIGQEAATKEDMAIRALESVIVEPMVNLSACEMFLRLADNLILGCSELELREALGADDVYQQFMGALEIEGMVENQQIDPAPGAPSSMRASRRYNLSPFGKSVLKRIRSR